MGITWWRILLVAKSIIKERAYCEMRKLITIRNGIIDL
jgi:hypothetical protein